MIEKYNQRLAEAQAGMIQEVLRSANGAANTPMRTCCGSPINCHHNTDCAVPTEPRPVRFNGRKTYETMMGVFLERERQHAKWGEQNPPDVNPSRDLRYVRLPASIVFTHENYGHEADNWKFVNEERAKEGKTAWDGILLEEVYEALAESDPSKLRAELVQVAAVAVAWIEAIDRRKAREAVTTKGTKITEIWQPGDLLPSAILVEPIEPPDAA